MKIGDLVYRRKDSSALFFPTLPSGLGIITHKVGKEIMYVYWGRGKPRPVNIRWLEKVQ